MSRYFLSAVFGFLCFVPSFSFADEGGAYRVVVEEGKYADVIDPNGDPILRYMYERDSSSPERSFDTAKVFAHVMAPGGKETLTKGAGGKFPHHRGIFIGWNRIEHDGKRHDLWHVRNTLQQHQEFLSTEGSEDGAIITSVISWVGVDGQTLIEEKRTYQILESSDSYALIDFTTALTAKQGDLKLGGDPEHAGVQFRPSQKVAENQSATYTFHEMGIDPKKDRDLPWVAASFDIDDQMWTVQHMNHPSNPRGAVWSAYRDYGRFGPFTVLKIAKGETVTLRYRFRVTKGDAPQREKMMDHYRQFSR
ncbi:MAG: PmoA family protein [Rubripirellula sp.]|nr:PmoA family protein [Rubripirellula sp.]